MSTAWPRSSASSCVSSMGKPYVVASTKASSAEIASLPASSSKTLSPRASVSENRSSSCFTVFSISAACSTRYGYASAICSITTAGSRCTSVKPMREPYCTARRMMRRAM